MRSDDNHDSVPARPWLATRALRVEIGGLTVCRGLDLHLEAGQCWALLGGNGVGKSTLLHTLAGLRPAAAGGVEIDGEPLQRYRRKHLARKLGLLFQEPHDSFPATVTESAMCGRHPYLSRWGWESPEDRSVTREALAMLELTALGHRQVDTLSGGERRRLDIATLLAQDPPVLLLDEPTNHLDLRHQIEILETLRQRVRSRGLALLMSLHDVNLAARFCDHALMLFGAGDCALGRVAELFDASTLSRLYGYPLAEAGAGPRRYFLPD